MPQKGGANPAWRPFKWGLIGAASAVAIALLLAAIRGLFFGQVSAFHGTYEPGWYAAYTKAMFMFFLGGLPISGIGFLVGFVAGLVRSSRR
jgi:hypothetical protein